MKKILLITITTALLAGIPAALYTLGYIQIGEPAAALADGEEAPVVPLEELTQHYLPIEPPFVVNFLHNGILRYLQVSIEVMYHDESHIAEVEEKMPVIRNDLIMLFSDQQFEQLNSMEGKQQLRGEIKQRINSIINVSGAAADRGDVYITNFVMQ